MVSIWLSTLHVYTNKGPEWTLNPFDSFVLVLGFSSSRLDKDSLSGADMKNEGFAPPGFFSKLIATILSKSTDIACRDQSEILSQHLVIFCYGAQKFRLRHIAALNCVIVDVEGKYALGVLRILEDLAQTVLDECMKTVKSRVFLPVETGPHSSIQTSLQTLSGCNPGGRSSKTLLLPSSTHLSSSQSWPTMLSSVWRLLILKQMK